MVFLDKAYEFKFREPTTKLETVLRHYAWADSSQVLAIVLSNWNVLEQGGLLEEAFVGAWTTQKYGMTGMPYWRPHLYSSIFAKLDRDRLLKAGDILPPGESFTVYRGVAGRGSRRRVRGYSWSGDEKVAKMFAEMRASAFHLANPAVYAARIHRENVLMYIDASSRNEKEFVLFPSGLSNLRRV